MKSLWDRVDFVFQKNDHTAAELLLYPEGFQQYTQTPDNAIFEALAGNDVDSGIADREFDEGDPADPDDDAWVIADSPLDEDESANRFDPDLGAELYITNGDLLDDAYASHGILGFTPRAQSRPTTTSRASSSRTTKGTSRPSSSAICCSRSISRSRPTIRRTRLFLGNAAEDFYVDDFAVSYGDPQTVEVTAKRSLGGVKLRYRVNGGRVQQAPTKQAPAGERFGDEPGVYYQRLRGEVRGTDPGDEVEVWFEAAAATRCTSPTGRRKGATTRCSCSPPRTTWPATPPRTRTARTT